MSETIDKPKNLIPILTQKLTEILDETKKPMTICEIQEKYNLIFSIAGTPPGLLICLKTSPAM